MKSNELINELEEIKIMLEDLAEKTTRDFYRNVINQRIGDLYTAQQVIREYQKQIDEHNNHPS